MAIQPIANIYDRVSPVLYNVFDKTCFSHAIEKALTLMKQQYEKKKG